MREADIQNLIRLKLNEIDGGIYFRGNAGQAWTGNDITKRGRTVTIRDARPFKSGLPPGFTDIFGITPIVITPKHVGQVLGIYTGIEVKNKTKLSPDQKNHILRLKNAGCLTGVAYCVEDAIKIVAALNGD